MQKKREEILLGYIKNIEAQELIASNELLTLYPKKTDNRKQ